MDAIQKNCHWRQQKLMLGFYVTLHRLQTVVTKRESLWVPLVSKVAFTAQPGTPRWLFRTRFPLHCIAALLVIGPSPVDSSSSRSNFYPDLHCFIDLLSTVVDRKMDLELRVPKPWAQVLQKFHCFQDWVGCNTAERFCGFYCNSMTLVHGFRNNLYQLISTSAVFMGIPNSMRLCKTTYKTVW